MLDFPCVTIPFRSTPEEMAECFQAADMNLSASRVEAFGCIPAEAQACGIPVVAFDSGGLADVVKTGIGGTSVRFNDVIGLTQAMGQLVDDEQLRWKLGRQGRDYVVEHFALQKVIQRYEALYEQLIYATAASVSAHL